MNIYRGLKNPMIKYDDSSCFLDYDLRDCYERKNISGINKDRVAFRLTSIIRIKDV